MKLRTDRPLAAYLVLVALISGGFVVGMKVMGQRGNYLAGPYMLTPALAAFFTRWLFYTGKFRDARLSPGNWRNYYRFWGLTLVVVALSYVFFTVFGAITWDLSGESFLSQMEEQMRVTGGSMGDLPEGMTPKMMLWLFFAGGLTIFNIPMTLAGFGEEFGWRGLMFPELCRRGAAAGRTEGSADRSGSQPGQVAMTSGSGADSRLIGGFVIGGLIWFAWHLPLMLVMPSLQGFTAAHYAVNGVILAFGSIFTFIFFAWTYARSGSIWVASLVHAVFNNGARSFSYFVRVENQIDANAGLAMTMLLVVAYLYWRGEFRIFGEFLRKER
ncbi:MAG TPA: CPBP family intramembrane glutamic endopeptidase [Candidatus Krumholzibacterium sp.]|nr:CPBP family intramembrane glutamic endopeptidase [Candidatus Krumholzibacterium sp.]